MVLKSVKFIVLRPRGIPQNLETEVNCSELISTIKNKLFPDDVKKECNIRLIYMGKILDDKKKLEDYVNYYQKEFFLNNSNNNNNSNSKNNNNNNNNNKKESSSVIGDQDNETSNKDTVENTESAKDNKNNIPVTIHVKITEKSICPKPTYMESKSVNTFLSQLSFLSLLILLWLYKYNYSHIFPVFSTTVLVVFTIFVLFTVFQFYVITIYCILLQTVVVAWKFLKNYSVRIYNYLMEQKQKIQSKLKSIKITQTQRNSEIKQN